jgi:hypothetical protein
MLAEGSFAALAWIRLPHVGEGGPVQDGVFFGPTVVGCGGTGHGADCLAESLYEPTAAVMIGIWIGSSA